MDRTTKIAALTALFAAALAMGGCAHSRPAAGPLTIRGELANGVECPLLLARDGRRYSVTGSLGAFKVGDSVCIRGTIVETSICMAGDATVAIETIGPEADCP